MTTNLVLWPVLIPLLTAIVLIFNYKRVHTQKIISSVSAVLGLGLAIYLLSRALSGEILTFFASNWVPPFGIGMVIDIFSAIMLLLSAIVSSACLFFAFKTVDQNREKTFFYIIWQLLIVGINGSFITGDIFNLYVFFEIMLLSSYVLLALGSEKGQLRETFKYTVINILSSAFFLVGLALLYGMVGTLNMADIAQKVAQVENQGLITLIAVIFMVVFGIKGALFPLYFWLPHSYAEPPAAVSALFSGLLTKVGVYAMVRVFTLIFINDVSFTHMIILIMGAGTMFFGVLGAIWQVDFKRILSFHVISQVGYMVMGLGLYTVLSITGTIYYIVHHIIVKSSLFLLSGVTEEITGTTKLKKMGGLLHNYPWLGWTFFISGLALAGIPPLSGFFAKFVLILSAAELDNYWIIAIAILVGFLTLFSMMKIFIAVYWGEEKPVRKREGFNYKKLLPPCLVLVSLSVIMGLIAPVMIKYAAMAANQLMNPEIYIDAVMSCVSF